MTGLFHAQSSGNFSEVIPFLGSYLARRSIGSRPIWNSHRPSAHYGALRLWKRTYLGLETVALVGG